MRQIRTYLDDRLGHNCAYCPGAPETRDHVPPKIFLEEPYPENLPVVPCCDRCNQATSQDEEFVACLLAVATLGGAEQLGAFRPRVRARLSGQPSLANLVASALGEGGDVLVTGIVAQRVSRVLAKIGRGIWTYETGEPTAYWKGAVHWMPLSSLSRGQRDAFLGIEEPTVVPEVGSRLTLGLLIQGSEVVMQGWQDVQVDVFSYSVDVYQPSGRIKMLFGGRIAAEVVIPSP